jgi:LmbE family N-acetylglucosaminyl deacetylase
MRVLVLAPHCDDAEVSCGATISKFLNRGHAVHVWNFSLAEKNFLPGVTREMRLEELSNSMKILGVSSWKHEDKSWYHRDMGKFRQEILDEMVATNASYRPDKVFMPSCDDVHQDHKVIATEGIRAFKHCSLYGYEMPWNNMASNHRMFVEVSEEDIQKKIDALKEYKNIKSSCYIDDTFIRSLATIRGAQIGCKYAESFEIIRYILR